MMRDTPVPLGSEEQQLATAVLLSLGGFIAQLAALWELADVTEDEVRPRDGDGAAAQFRAATEASLARLSPADRVHVAAAGAEWIEAMLQLSQNEIGIAFGYPHGGAAASAVAERAQAALADLLSAYPDLPSASTFTLGFLDAFTRVPRVDVMYESIVIGAVSALHVQLRSLTVTVDHDRLPLLSDEQVSSRVERLLRGGIPRWRGWLREGLGCDISIAPGDLARASEILARRNLFVHHGGVVSSRYRSAIPDAPPIGTRLIADAAYAREALATLALLGTQIAVTAWGAYRPTFRSSTELLALFLTQHYAVPVRAWPLVGAVARWLTDGASNVSQREFARVLAALAAKRRGDAGGVHELCDLWIPAQPDLALVRQVLLGEMDAAFESATQMLDNRTLTLFDLESWPALEDLRAQPKWESLRTAAERAGRPNGV